MSQIRPTLLTSCSALILYSVSLFAYADAFSDVYSEFQSALAANQHKKALKLAEKSYHLGVEKFGENSVNTEALIFNYGNMLVANYQYKDAISVFMEVERRYEKRYGKYSAELFELYITIVDAMDSLDEKTERLFRKQHVDYLRKIILKMPGALDDLGDPEAAIALYYQGALAIKSAAYLPSFNSSIVKYMDRAIAMMSKHLNIQDERLIMVQFLQADFLKIAGDEDKAIAQLENIVQSFEHLGEANHRLALLSRGRLVAFFEDAGESEKATEHCVAIGKMTPWNENQYAQPIYRIEADYPNNYESLQKEGSALISYEIDDKGFVRNAEIKATQGGSLFGEAAKKAIEKWRFAPKFVEGKAVSVKGQQTNYRFFVRRFNL
ncbi:energy transducer TonB [Alteromonas ponticola]|uniref:Energy transducer TonB n=1 Tax=Alteromonas aquimaris TaxID=2998417 RepID=A0ABT3P7D7_9ALTE|nr:TonB family protein [Alteromonas aquimaris]MCW8108686.1 energy transducer TonB [Alteromonas aquimaris]